MHYVCLPQGTCAWSLGCPMLSMSDCALPLIVILGELHMPVHILVGAILISAHQELHSPPAERMLHM